MWNRRGELKQQTRRAVAVGQVDDVPVGAVKRQCVRYRKTYKLVLALAPGGNCKMIVKTACLYKRHIYSRWARENLIFSLVPYVGLNSSKTLQLQGAHTRISRSESLSEKIQLAGMKTAICAVHIGS